MNGFDSRWLAEREGAEASAPESAGLDPLAAQAVAYVESLGAEPLLAVAYPGPFPSTNDYWSSPHWTKRNAEAKAWKKRTPACAPLPEAEYPVWAWGVGLFEKGSRRYDEDGVAVAKKLTVDALVQEDVLVNDSMKYVSAGVTTCLRSESGRGFVLVLTKPL